VNTLLKRGSIAAGFANPVCELMLARASMGFVLWIDDIVKVSR